MSNSLLDSQLEKLLREDKELLEQSNISMVTVSSTFREELKAFHGLTHDELARDVVFSRAHFSMALGVAVQAWKTAKKSPPSLTMLKQKRHLPAFANPKEAWLIDPTNYVLSSKWSKIKITENIGKILARNPLLKKLKDFVDKNLRNNLPITDAITPPLLHVFQHVHQPIISVHYEAGNILASVGKKVVQVVTDPHIRDQYFLHANLSNMMFCVFDEKTKADFIEKAVLYGKGVDPDRIIVTGPPIDPRIIAARKAKQAEKLRTRPLRICVTTGGLGTNKQEIEQVLQELFDFLRKRPIPIQLLCYGGTQHDFTLLVEHIAKTERIAIDDLENEQGKFRLIHGKHIMSVNEELIRYGFSWADCFITKPSGDMAYDAAAAGCSLLFLQPWGEWEENIQHIFEQLKIGRKAEVQHIKQQVEILAKPALENSSWFETAQANALHLPSLFLHGSSEILKVAKHWNS